ncbi:hypothetical protein KAR91_53760 [Candidatus Pacearchaeota archaeon]|nr:hypothetical protein [Candidatus Pacearchaeota archaeon]
MTSKESIKATKDIMERHPNFLFDHKVLRELISTIEELQGELKREREKLHCPDVNVLRHLRGTIDNLQITLNEKEAENKAMRAHYQRRGKSIFPEVEALKAENERLNKLMPHIRETCKWMFNTAYDKISPDSPCGEDMYKCQLGLDCFNEKWELNDEK